MLGVGKVGHKAALEVLGGRPVAALFRGAADRSIAALDALGISVLSIDYGRRESAQLVNRFVQQTSGVVDKPLYHDTRGVVSAASDALLDFSGLLRDIEARGGNPRASEPVARMLSALLAAEVFTARPFVSSRMCALLPLPLSAEFETFETQRSKEISAKLFERGIFARARVTGGPAVVRGLLHPDTERVLGGLWGEVLQEVAAVFDFPCNSHVGVRSAVQPHALDERLLSAGSRPLRARTDEMLGQVVVEAALIYAKTRVDANLVARLAAVVATDLYVAKERSADLYVSAFGTDLLRIGTSYAADQGPLIRHLAAKNKFLTAEQRTEILERFGTGSYAASRQRAFVASVMKHAGLLIG